MVNFEVIICHHLFPYCYADYYRVYQLFMSVLKLVLVFLVSVNCVSADIIMCV